MEDVYLAAVKRSALLELVKAFGCRDVALWRDECGDWAIFGKHGMSTPCPPIGTV